MLVTANSSNRIFAITAKHSLFRLSHTRNSIGSPCGLLSSCKENYGFSTFRLSTTDGLGSAFSPVAQHLRWKRLEFPSLTTYLFGLSLTASLADCPSEAFINSSLSLTMPSYSSELIGLDAGSRLALSQRLNTPSLLTTHTLVESDWENNRRCQLHRSYSSDFVSHQVIGREADDASSSREQTSILVASRPRQFGVRLLSLI